MINLVLVDATNGWSTDRVSHLDPIAKCVNKYDRGVRAIVVRHRSRDQLKLLPLWFQPTLTLCFNPIYKRKLLPGRLVSTGPKLDNKITEFKRLDAAGVPVPKWTEITPGLKLDPDEWGPYVVEKPSMGKRGAFVRIRRTTRVKYQAPESYPEDHYGRSGPMIAQRFIYTGEQPISYRVLTLFGKALVCYRQTNTNAAPLAGRWEFHRTGGNTVVATAMGNLIETSDDPEVIACAESAHMPAFPEYPTLGFDVIRDADTGEMFILECQPGYMGWWLDSQRALAIAEGNDLDFRVQFGAIDKTARVLIDYARENAKAGWPHRIVRDDDPSTNKMRQVA